METKTNSLIKTSWSWGLLLIYLEYKPFLYQWGLGFAITENLQIVVASSR